MTRWLHTFSALVALFCAAKGHLRDRIALAIMAHGMRHPLARAQHPKPKEGHPS